MRSGHSGQAIDDDDEGRLTELGDGRAAELGLLEIVIVNYHCVTDIIELTKQLPTSIGIVLVDNANEHRALSSLDARGRRIEIVDMARNVGFAKAANTGFRRTKAAYVLFLNPDTRPTADAIATLLRMLLDQPEIAAVGPALVDVDGRIQHAGGGWQPRPANAITHLLGINSRWTHPIVATPSAGRITPVGWLAGTCLMVRRAPFEDVGGFDESYFLYGEDVGLGRRLASAGWSLVLAGTALVEHRGGGSAPGDPASLWLQRGNALGMYLKEQRSIQASITRGILVLSHLVRWLVCRVVPSWRPRVKEMRVYARQLAFPTKRCVEGSATIAPYDPERTSAGASRVL